MPFPLRVLLLEDREEDAALTLLELRQAGFDSEWRRVQDGAGFAEALDASLDVILADYRLPGWSGLAALNLVQARGLDIPFILVSGTIGEETAVDAMRRGAADYVLKDRLARLGTVVHHQLYLKRLRDEKRRSEAAHAAEQQRAEEALRESEERHRLLFQSSPLPMWVYDRETLRFLAVNRTAVLHYGYSEAEFLASTIRDIRPPEDLPRLEETLSRIRPGSRGVTEIWRHRKKNGEIIDVELTSDSIVLDGRNARLVLAVDVTERKRADGALREAAALLGIAGRTARLGGWSIEVPPGRFTFSDEMCALLEIQPGITPEPGEALELFMPEWREPFQAAFLACVQDGTPFDLELEVMTGSGRRCWGRCIGEARRNAAGTITRVHGSFQDITDRRKAEEALRLSEQKYRDIIEFAPVGFEQTTLAGRSTMANRRFAEMFGYQSPEDLMDVDISRELYADPEDRQRFLASVEREGFIAGAELCLKRKDGTPLWVEVNARSLTDASGKMIATEAFVTSIDDRKRSEQALLESEERYRKANRLSSLGRLAATIAHEFNNVLMGIQPFAEVIARNAGSSESLVTAAGHITSSVKRGKRITQEILRFTQPAQPVVRPLGVQPWLRDLEVEVKSLLPQGITLEMQDASPDIHMLGDPSQLQQIFVNLLLNAKDAMPHGGRLTVSAAVDGDDTVYPFGFVVHPSRYVRLTVSDTGGGMSSETMRQIFEPLFTTKPAGTGLGLAVTHQVVSRHGGEIFVESREGAGTSFHLFIPRAHGESGHVPPAGEPLRKPLQRVRLLLVEDDESVSTGLVSILELEGFHVDVVNRGALALEAVSRLAPDAVVLDVGLPDMSGIDVYRQIAAQRPDLPVIFSTGHGDEGELEPYLERRNVGYLLKPYDSEVLLDRLSRLLLPVQ